MAKELIFNCGGGTAISPDGLYYMNGVKMVKGVATPCKLGDKFSDGPPKIGMPMYFGKKPPSYKNARTVIPVIRKKRASTRRKQWGDVTIAIGAEISGLINVVD